MSKDDKKAINSGREDSTRGPQILRAANIGSQGISRRQMIQDTGIAAAATAAAVGVSGAGCGGPSEYDMVVENGECRCHFVCTCDTVSDKKGSQHAAEWTGGTCTCNTVCTCDTVCTCESHSSSSGGGGGGTYWYPN